MILTGPEIEHQIKEGRIEIDPFDPRFVGPNSVDLHLGNEMKIYDKAIGRRATTSTINGGLLQAIDPADPPPLRDVEPINRAELTWLLEPGLLYISTTSERTYCKGFVPRIDCRSSAARVGLSAHQTAGQGDDGFDGQWTLELTVAEPLLVHAGGRFFQILFETIKGERRPYGEFGRYQYQEGATGTRFHIDTDRGHS